MAAKAERLVNLVVALLHVRRPLTFAELRTRLGEWQDGEAASERRKFERDKDELRRLGVPIETVPLSALGGELAYTIDPRQYALPDVALEVEHVTAIAVALQLLDGGPAPLAWAKLSARAPDPRRAEAPGGIRVRVDTSAAVPLAEAVVGRRVVRFDYRTADGRASRRTVDPAAVVNRAGHSYLVGHDHDRQGQRAFRLDRVEGAVEVLAQDAGPVPEGLDLAALVDGPSGAPVTAVLRIGDEQVTVTAPRRQHVTRALRRAGQVELVEPAALRDEISGALAAVLAAHDAGERGVDQ